MTFGKMDMKFSGFKSGSTDTPSTSADIEIIARAGTDTTILNRAGATIIARVI